MLDPQNQIVMKEVTDPQGIVETRARRERFDRNSAWLQTHAKEVYTRHRGKCICIAGQELFVGDTPEEVLARARAAHPEEDGGILIRFIPRQKMARIYAY